MLAFAGRGKATAPALRSTQDRLDAIQSFGFDSISYTVVFIAVASILGLFVLSFLVQERVEEKKFLYPGAKMWAIVWLLMSTGTKLIAVSALLPMLRVLVEAFDCNFADSGAVWEALPGLQCGSGQHIPYVVAAAVIIMLYLPLAFRLLRVRGVLAAIEVRKNPFDWRGDVDIATRRTHSLALRSNKYWLANMLVKCLLTVLGVLLSSEPVIVSLLQVLVGVFLFVLGTRHPPYFLRTCFPSLRPSINRVGRGVFAA